MRWPNENTVAGLSAAAVDDLFWSLVCQDEEWLRTEFDAIVGAAAEQHLHPTIRPVVAVDRGRIPRSDRNSAHQGVRGRGRPVGPNWRRERSPPPLRKRDP